MSVDTHDSPEESILYELLEYVVRKQEPELIKCRNDTVILPTSGTIKNALLYLNKRYSAALPESISQHASLTLPWKFAVGDSGRLLAVLQENVIEIRRLKDEYSSVIGRASVPRDAFPQWRKLAWSPDGSILALSSSNGQTSFYNSLGISICNATSDTASHNPDILEAGDAVASMIFKKPNDKNGNWDSEFIQVTYGGCLTSYLISSTNGCKRNHDFSFGHFYRNGINAVSYCDKRGLFFVAGNSIYQPLVGTTSKAGLTAWRQLNDYPFYKLSTSSGKEQVSNSTRFSFWNIIVPSLKAKSETIIFKMSISPSNEILACLHTDGTVSLWRIPNLQLVEQWKLSDQPDYNAPNPINAIKYRKYPSAITEFHPLDIGWWSDQALVIARYSGAISICSRKNLKNLLGASPEFLSGPIQVVESSAIRGVLCLDCEMHVASTKRNGEESEENSADNVDSDKESSDPEPMTLANYASNLFKSMLYLMTDMEKFQPKRRKSKIFHRTYRILGLKSTTPEELYARKIEIEEYEEALNLAKTYNLDTDLVYQTQWRKSQFSFSAIHEHLGKVSKSCWVLNECVSRVPDNLLAARELLDFGLLKASLEILVASGADEKDPFEPIEEDDFVESGDISITLRKAQKTNSIIEKLDVSKFTENQEEIIRFRQKLLKHMDMLKTYEMLLLSPDDYVKEFYQNFRQMPALENAVKFAKDGNCQGVDVMFTYFGSELLTHWLPIISFFPETLDPVNYKQLLPRCDVDEHLYLLDQQELRQIDWSERTEFSEITPFANEDDDRVACLVYKDNPWFTMFRNVTLTQELLRNWYKHRCYEIEQNSRLVDNALSLINIGKSHNISGLEKLLTELETLDDLVYKVGLEGMSLIELDKLDDLEKIKLLMSQTNETNFVKNVENVLLPFAQKKLVYLEKSFVKHLLRNYFIYLSKNRLCYIVDLYKHFSKNEDPRFRDVLGDTIKLAIDCIYHCESPDMFLEAKEMFDIISKQCGKEKTQVPQDVLESLEEELDALEILNRYAVRIPLRHIKICVTDAESIKTLLSQIGETLKSLTPSANENTWAQLLSDILDIQGLVFRNFDIDTCLEIYLSARLKSGSKATIQNSKSLMGTAKGDDDASFFKVSYDKGVGLILDACNEYFNTAKSLTDYNMDLAKACLYLVEKENARIKDELDLISSLQILNEFNLNVLPLQVKLTRNRLQLVDDCLKSRSDSYKSQQRLLTLAKHLRIDGNSRVQEGKVLELIMQRALEAEDYGTCHSTVQRLIDIGYQNAWMAALKLARHDDYKDLSFRRYCLWFVVDTGPNDLLEETIKRLNILETEILDTDLKKWMQLRNENLESELGSDDDIPDAAPSKKVESKEMLPKIFETSSKLVKNSTLVVTQSMIDVVKNRDFWSGNLKNLLKRPENLSCEESDEKDAEKCGVVQSFPCFYESLHQFTKLSNLDTKYGKYSKPSDVNDELKLCQMLLRVQMLRESSSCGAERSDINHLLIECARNTLDQDCLLGLGYLLSLKKDFATNVKNMFDNLSRSELHKQFAAWYYSLKLVKSVGTNYDNVHLYDPLRVINFVGKITSTIEERNEIATLLNEQLRIEKLNDVNDEIENRIEEREETRDEEMEKLEKENKQTTMGSVKVEDDGWDDKWDDADWDDVSNQESNQDVEEISEKDRYQKFEDMFARITTKDSYLEVKNLLRSSCAFSDSELICLEKNPVLKMAKKAAELGDKHSAHYEKEVLEEFQNLLKDGSISEELLNEFVATHGDEFSIQPKIYLRLLSGESHYNEVVEILRTRREETCPVILEELFFRNLTPRFSPTHRLYYSILEEVFLNRTIPEIRKNVEILIDELMQQNNVPHAIALLNQLERIPPSLSTYDSCFQLLLKPEKQ